jgi:hypothetical protein
MNNDQRFIEKYRNHTLIVIDEEGNIDEDGSYDSFNSEDYEILFSITKKEKSTVSRKRKHDSKEIKSSPNKSCKKRFIKYRLSSQL